MSKIWLPENVRDSLKVEETPELKQEAELPDKKEVELKPKKRVLFNTKNILKKCRVCGKTEYMSEQQLRCHECIVNSNAPKNRCSICGRHSRSLIKVGEQRLCSFCLRNKTSKISLNPTVPRKYCSDCGHTIWESTYHKFNGLCKYCYALKEIVLERPKQIILEENPMEPKKCKMCGIKFYIVRTTKIFCSMKCRGRYHHLKAKGRVNFNG